MGWVAVYKRLRILVPVAQILAVIAVFASKSALKGRTSLIIHAAVMVLAKQVNYPVWVVVYPIMVGIEKSQHYLPVMLVDLLSVLASALLPVGVFWLWYALITEIEMRRRGRSMLKFAASWKTLLCMIILLAFAAGAFAKAYVIGSGVIHERLGYLRYLLALGHWDELVGMLILTTWGLLLVGVAIHDLTAMLGARRRAFPSADSP
jgi:hypothetical protein